MSKTSISKATLDSIAKTATIEVPQALKVSMCQDLEKVVELFRAMDKIQVCETKKSDSIEIDYAQLRKDGAVPNQADKSSMATYRHYDTLSGNFVVPKVIDTEV